jgi:hypothetical protein
MKIFETIGFIVESVVYIVGYMVTIGLAAIFAYAWALEYLR